VRHAATVVFPVDFDGGEHVYRVHPINVQLVTYSLIMPAKEEHECASGSESLDRHKPRDILHCHVERRDQSSLFQKGQNDRIKGERFTDQCVYESGRFGGGSVYGLGWILS
jgi:hypothetical protein